MGLQGCGDTGMGSGVMGLDDGGGELRVCGGLKQETDGRFDPTPTDQMLHVLL